MLTPLAEATVDAGLVDGIGYLLGIGGIVLAGLWLRVVTQN